MINCTWSKARLERVFHGHALHLAVINDDAESVKAYLRAEFGAFSLHLVKHFDGHTPLSLAIALNRNDLVHLFLRNGADPNANLSLGSDALGFDGAYSIKLSNFTARCGNAHAYEMLIVNGLDINVMDRGCAVPIQRAAQSPNPAILALLLKAGADPDANSANRVGPAVMIAAAHEDEAMVGLLIAAGADLDVRNANKDTLATVAAANRNAKVMEMLMAAGMPFDGVGATQRTPCHVAALNPNEAVLALLLAAGCDTGRRDANGETPCHLAAKNENPDVLRMLLDAGADANAVAARGRTPLHRAAANTNDAVIALLLAAKVDLGDSVGLEVPLKIAVANPNERVLARLLAAGSRLRSVSSLCVVAAANSNPLVMRMLLDAGGTKCVTKARAVGDSALWTAAKSGSEAVVAMLIAAGAKEDRVDRDGATICHRAATNRDAGVMRQLIASGVDVDELDADDRTPCRVAVEAGNCAVVSVLLAAGADVNSADSDGVTLCHRAARLEDVSILRLLLRRGAWPDVVDKLGRSPAHAAGANGLAVLFAAGASIDLCDNHGVTPFLQTVTGGQQDGEPLITLMAAGANLDVMDMYKRTAVTHIHTNPQRAVKRGLLAAVGRRQAGWNDVTTSLVEWSVHSLCLRHLELVRLRGVEICIGLHAQQLSAVEMCAILENMCSPSAIDVPFHKLWAIVTTAKHFHDRQRAAPAPPVETADAE